MTKIKGNQKLENIIDEFADNFSCDSDNYFMIEFAERNLKEFIDNPDDLITELNRFTADKSIKVAVYVYIFGLLIDYLSSDNQRTTELMDTALLLIVNLLAEANNKIKAEKEIAENYKYALDKLQNKQCDKEKA